MLRARVCLETDLSYEGVINMQILNVNMTPSSILMQDRIIVIDDNDMG